MAYEDYSKEELLQEIEELKKKLKDTKYGLCWDKEHTKENVVLECENKIPVLVSDNSKKILLGENSNILIEGDNFHALTCLNYIMKESIDVIYIDPPYNTGHEDFEYNDKYINSDDGYIHSKWLTFMKHRLVLAKDLMKKDGSCFISIDDHEQANLRMLCNQIFGERNVEQYIWCLQDKSEGSFVKTAGLTVRKEHEYIIACFKDNSKRFNRYLGKREFSDNIKDNPDNDPRGPWFSGNISRNGIKSTTGSKYYTITNPAGEEFTRNWTLSKEEYEEALKDNRIYFSKGGAGVPRLKIFASENAQLIQSSLFTDVHTSITGKNELKRIFDGESPFDFPKPTSLIKRLLEIGGSKDSIVLDFFAGSGTTGQAVLELNQEDGGNRKFILCTNNENDICTSITYPRLKTVITGLRGDGSKYSDGIPSNLYYFKTDFVKDEKNTDQAKYCLVEKVDSLLCILEDTYENVSRNDYSSHYVSNDNLKHMFIYNDYYNKEQFEEFKNQLNNVTEQKVVYMFATDNNVDYSLFEGIENIEVKPIPSKIYEIYKEIVEDIKRG